MVVPCLGFVIVMVWWKLFQAPWLATAQVYQLDFPHHMYLFPSTYSLENKYFSVLPSWQERYLQWRIHIQQMSLNVNRENCTDGNIHNKHNTVLFT